MVYHREQQNLQGGVEDAVRLNLTKKITYRVDSENLTLPVSSINMCLSQAIDAYPR